MKVFNYFQIVLALLFTTCYICKKHKKETEIETIMATTLITLENINQDMVGKLVTINFTGITIEGVISKISDDVHSWNIDVDFISPKTVKWGNDTYNNTTKHIRKPDGYRFGDTYLITKA
jgi:hypothetical protein